MYIFLLILNVIVAKEIGSFSEDKSKKSSNPQIRQKRLIDPRRHGDRPVKIEDVPYIVYIEEEAELICGGSILAPNIVVTAAHCIEEENVTYTVHSGSSNIYYGRFHYVKMKLIHPGYHSHGLKNDLALLLISPPIDFKDSSNRKILLYNKNLPTNTFVTLSGWGLHRIRKMRRIYPEELRSIVVPTISIKECAKIYNGVTTLTDKDICTHDRIEKKFATDGDSGGPLVVNGYLAGVMAWNGDREGKRANNENPDVFVNVAHPFYRNWITANIRLINGDF